MRKLFANTATHTVSLYALWLIIGGAVILFLQLGYITFDIYSGSGLSRAEAILLYRSCFGEYIMSELLLLVLGAFLIDLAERGATAP